MKKKLETVLIILILLIGLIGYVVYSFVTQDGRAGHWNTTSKQQQIDICKQSHPSNMSDNYAKEYCQCEMDAISQRYTITDTERMANSMTVEEKTVWQDITNSCIQKANEQTGETYSQ